MGEQGFALPSAVEGVFRDVQALGNGFFEHGIFYGIDESVDCNLRKNRGFSCLLIIEWE